MKKGDCHDLQIEEFDFYCQAGRALLGFIGSGSAAGKRRFVACHSNRVGQPCLVLGLVLD